MDEFSKNLQLLENLGFTGDPVDDNFHDELRFWDPEHKEHITLSINLIENLIPLMRVIQAYNSYLTK
jgi:hypothetical protein